MSLEPTPRQRVLRAFKTYTEANGYKCQEHIKRMEEITCRGPKDMHVTFEPELNEPVFVARFNWVRTGDRTHEEFERHVAAFARAIRVEGVRVRLAEGDG
jgi:hypothetical protein